MVDDRRLKMPVTVEGEQLEPSPVNHDSKFKFILYPEGPADKPLSGPYPAMRRDMT